MEIHASVGQNKILLCFALKKRCPKESETKSREKTERQRDSPHYTLLVNLKMYPKFAELLTKYIYLRWWADNLTKQLSN